jgi:hypothetical protein
VNPELRASLRDKFAAVQVQLPSNGELHRAHVEVAGKPLPIRAISINGVVGERGVVVLTIPMEFVDLELVD